MSSRLLSYGVAPHSAMCYGAVSNMNVMSFSFSCHPFGCHAARDALGEPEAAADALISVLQLPAPMEAGESSQIAGLASRVSASLKRQKVWFRFPRYS